MKNKFYFIGIFSFFIYSSAFATNQKFHCTDVHNKKNVGIIVVKDNSTILTMYSTKISLYLICNRSIYTNDSFVCEGKKMNDHSQKFHAIFSNNLKKNQMELEIIERDFFLHYVGTEKFICVMDSDNR